MLTQSTTKSTASVHTRCHDRLLTLSPFMDRKARTISIALDFSVKKHPGCIFQCISLINRVFIFSVALSSYRVVVDEEQVMLGNEILLKCDIPSFVADFVVVDGWVDSEGLGIADDGNYQGNQSGQFPQHSNVPPSNVIRERNLLHVALFYLCNGVSSRVGRHRQCLLSLVSTKDHIF